jgi:hypothetical protein
VDQQGLPAYQADADVSIGQKRFRSTLTRCLTGIEDHAATDEFAWPLSMLSLRSESADVWWSK